MTIHWIQLIVGLAFGLVPMCKLLNTECRYLIFEDLWAKVIKRDQPGQRRRRWWKLPMVWIDPFRGYVAADYLLGAITPAPDAPGFLRIVIMGICGGLVLTTVWAQTLGRVEERETISPAGFLAGVLIASLPPAVAAAAIVMGASTAVAMRSYNAGYIVATLTTFGIGFLFMGKSATLVILTVVTALPMLLNWLRGSRLVTPVRC